MWKLENITGFEDHREWGVFWQWRTWPRPCLLRPLFLLFFVILTYLQITSHQAKRPITRRPISCIHPDNLSLLLLQPHVQSTWWTRFEIHDRHISSCTEVSDWPAFCLSAVILYHLCRDMMITIPHAVFTDSCASCHWLIYLYIAMNRPEFSC